MMENLLKINIIKIYKVIIVILIGSLVFLLTSCKKEIKPISEEIEIGSFTSIEIESAGEFNIEYSTESKIVFKGDEEFFNLLDVEVIDGKLIIDTKEEINKDFGKIAFFITMPIIKSLEIGGSAEVVLNDFVEQEQDLFIEILGQGNIKINNFEKVKKLDIEISGNGTIDALSNFRNLKELNIDITGSGEYNGYLLETEKCNVDISGYGNCKVNVRKLLNIDITGSGEVYYKGSAAIKSNVGGAGFVLNQN